VIDDWHMSCIDQSAEVIYVMEVSPKMAQDTKTKPKDEAKPKVESKPVVETKAAGDVVKKSRKLWIPLGILVLAIAAGGTAFFAYPHFRGSHKSANQEPKKAQVKAVLPLESFLVNLADHDNICFVKATFQLGLEEEWKGESKNSVEMASIRDAIISLLTSKTSDQLMTSQGKDKLREEIRLRVNAVSPKVKVVEVYIYDFVIQL
jgi:flagellar protein FliL